jgi:hypothetical protein
MRPNTVAEFAAESRPSASQARLFLQELGLCPLEARDMPDAHALAARLIGPGIASAATLSAVHERTGGDAVFVLWEQGEITGVVAYAPLNRDGLDALVRDDFDGVSPDLAHVAGEGERPRAAYGWGMAGSTPAGRKAVVQAGIALYERVLPDTPWFSRAATPDGRRVVLGKFGFSPAPWSGSGLMVRWPSSPERAA